MKIHSRIALVLMAMSLTSLSFAAPPQTYHPISRTSLDGAEGWDYLAIDANAHRLYITRGVRVVVMDTETNKVVGEIKDTIGVHDIALAPALGRGFTSNGRDNSVTIFDLKTLKPLETVKVGKNPDAITYDRASKKVFTFNGSSHDTTVLDALTGKVEKTIDLGGRPEFAVTDGKGMLFVNIEDKGEVVVLDTKSLEVKAHWSLAPGEEPTGLAIDRKNHRLFSVCKNEKMVILDSESGKVIATPAIGKGADAALYDPATHLAFSSNGQDGTLTILKEDKPGEFTLAETVPTEVGARTMTLDPKTHKIYLVTAKMQPPAPGEENTRRRAYVPGSFVVLVYAPK